MIDLPTIRERLAFWQKQLELSDWFFEPRIEDFAKEKLGQDHNDDVAFINIAPIRKSAIVFFNQGANWSDKYIYSVGQEGGSDEPPNDIDGVVVHELLHILHYPERSARDHQYQEALVRTGLSTERCQAELDIAEEQLKEPREALLEQLARVIAATYRKGVQDGRTNTPQAPSPPDGG